MEKDIKQEFNSVKREIKQVDQKVKKVDQKVKKVDQKVDRLIRAMYKGFESADKKFDETKKDIGELKQGQAEILGEIKDIKEEKLVRDYQIEKERRWRDIVNDNLDLTDQERQEINELGVGTIRQIKIAK